jgi:hypothetical protein
MTKLAKFPKCYKPHGNAYNAECQERVIAQARAAAIAAQTSPDYSNNDSTIARIDRMLPPLAALVRAGVYVPPILGAMMLCDGAWGVRVESLAGVRENLAFLLKHLPKDLHEVSAEVESSAGRTWLKVEGRNGKDGNWFEFDTAADLGFPFKLEARRNTAEPVHHDECDGEDCECETQEEWKGTLTIEEADAAPRKVAAKLRAFFQEMVWGK